MIVIVEILNAAGNPPGSFIDLLSEVGEQVELVRRAVVETWWAWAPVLQSRAVEACDLVGGLRSIVGDLVLSVLPHGSSPAVLYVADRAASFLTISVLTALSLLLATVVSTLVSAIHDPLANLAVRRHQGSQRLRVRAVTAQAPIEEEDPIALGEDAPELDRAKLSHLAALRWKLVRPDRIEGAIRDSRGRPSKAALVWDRFRRHYEVQLSSSVLNGFMRASNYRACLSQGRLNYHVNALPEHARRDPAAIIESLHVFALREERTAARRGRGAA